MKSSSESEALASNGKSSDSDPEPPRAAVSKFLEFYRLTLEHREKLISIIMVSGIAVAIPAAVDAYKASIERDTKELSLKLESDIKGKEIILKDKEQKLEELKFRQSSIQSFSSTGLQQDIELRIRLAEYFANLSDDDYKTKWETYRRGLVDKREADKRALDALNDQIDDEESKTEPNSLLLRKLYRARGWLEAEFNPIHLSEPATLKTGNLRSRLPANEGLSVATESELVEIFGFPVKDRKTVTDTCQVDVDSEPLKKLLRTENTSIGNMTLIEPALESLKGILKKITEGNAQIASRMQGAGSLCVRWQRGDRGSLSRHAFGLAVDIMIGGKLPRPEDKETENDLLVIASEFNNAGWLWGGAFRSLPDYPHFEVSHETLTAWQAAGLLNSR